MYYKIRICKCKKLLVSHSPITRENTMDHANCCEAAAKDGRLDILQQLVQDGHQLGHQTCQIAAQNGHLACLKYAYENGASLTLWASIMAAEFGHLECFKYVYQNTGKLHEMIINAAVKGGHLNCLKYAHKKGCPWDTKWTTVYAAMYGHIECLIYVHRNGCPWVINTCFAAAGNGHLNCLKYAHKNGCPWDASVCKVAAANGHLDCLQYAYENGCPVDRWTLLNIGDITADPDTTQDEQLCNICYVNLIKIQSLPCNHTVCCKSCFQKIYKYQKKCPMCRSEIVDFAELTNIK